MIATRHLPISLIAAATLSVGLVACGSDNGSDSTNAATADASADASDGSAADDDHDHDAADVVETAISAGSEYLGEYTLVDDTFGTVTAVTIDGDNRVIEANALPNHDTGEFPNAGNPNEITEQDAAYSYPLVSTWTGEPTDVRTVGVAVNGVKFEPGTAETVTCESGELYRVEALQDTYDLGLDFNNAHVQPNGEYHYHGISELLVDAFTSDDDLVHIGFAADGHLIYASPSGAYSSSYQLSSAARTGTGCVASGAAGGDAVEIDGSSSDGTYTDDWDFVEGSGDLDECNGITIDGGYVYMITEEFPYVPRCLMGEVADDGTAAPSGPGRGAPPTNG
ncbi:MAG: YHYH protein [Actinomycetota bacterium]